MPQRVTREEGNDAATDDQHHGDHEVHRSVDSRAQKLRIRSHQAQMHCAVREGECQHHADDRKIARLARTHDGYSDHDGKHRKEGAIEQADERPGCEIAGRERQAPERPECDEGTNRSAAQRLGPAPVGHRRQQEAGDRRNDCAVDHLMRVQRMGRPALCRDRDAAQESQPRCD